MKYILVLFSALLLAACGEKEPPSNKLLCDCANESLASFAPDFIEKLNETARTSGDFHETIMKLTDNKPDILIPSVEMLKAKWEKGLEKIITENYMTDEQWEKYLEVAMKDCPDQIKIIYYFMK
jgi:hypothetical protein